MFQRKLRSARRRGVSAIQLAVVLGALTLAIIASVQFVGDATDRNLDNSANMTADPAALAAHFNGQSCDHGDDDDGDGGD
jgi:Flp pilus assembly pilin Flp